MKLSPLSLLVAGALAGAASAQLASSTNYELRVFDLDGGGGGLCSVGYAAFVSLSEMPDGSMASPGYSAAIGFLATSDPEPGNTPVIFGITPEYGPKEGGTPVTISGLNFDKLGAGISLTVDFGGVPATNVNVLSDTLLTCDTPAAGPGPADVVVATSFGPTTVDDGYVFTPAILSSPTTVLGGTVEITNIGPPGWQFDTYWSTNTTSVMTPFGLQLIGPAPLTLLLDDVPYPLFDGKHVFTLPVPMTPSLVGFTAHLQSGAMQLAPFELVLTNAASTTIQ